MGQTLELDGVLLGVMRGENLVEHNERAIAISR